MNYQKKHSALTTIKEWVLITIGIAIYTLGWSLFLTSNNLFGGGVSGISAIIQFATGIKMGYTYLVINVVLLIVSLFIIGPSFGIKTVYAVLMTSFGLNFFQSILPPDLIQDFALSNGKLLCAIMGGAMSGLGIGLSISQGGSTGGTDIIALIIGKYRNVSPGRIIMIIDIIIISSSLLIPSYDPEGNPLSFISRVSAAMFGFIIVTVAGNIVDIYLAGSKQSVQVFIMSKKFDEIADMVHSEFNRGVTVLHGEGWYTKQESSILMVLTRKTDVNLLLRYIKQIDPNAFLSISSVWGVFGQGFDTIKDNLKPKGIPSGFQKK
ncbi:MAG: YitT family protein [Candidatus Cryptobacteroides sp.]